MRKDFADPRRVRSHDLGKMDVKRSPDKVSVRVRGSSLGVTRSVTEPRDWRRKSSSVIREERVILPVGWVPYGLKSFLQCHENLPARLEGPATSLLAVWFRQTASEPEKSTETCRTYIQLPVVVEMFGTLPSQLSKGDLPIIGSLVATTCE